MIPVDRCQMGIDLLHRVIFMSEINAHAISTRCRLRRGHNGPHKAYGLNRYTHFSWYPGDGRERPSIAKSDIAWYTVPKRGKDKTERKVG